VFEDKEGVLKMHKSGKYLPGDLHLHSVLSDGSHTLDDILSKAFTDYKLSWLGVSDHGGAFKRDTDGNPLISTNPQGIRGEIYGKKGYMWRSQSIIDYGEPMLNKLRTQYPNKLIIHSVELNVPPKGHACVAILEDEPNALANFEYCFDAMDLDQSLSLEKNNESYEDAILAVKYLEKNYSETSYFIINHPSTFKAFSPRFMRALQDAAPKIVNGFEGIPGHQFRTVRGCYWHENGSDSYLHRTYGGADYFLAKVGGMWDSLLGEGRRFYVFGNSDFHEAGEKLDPYPGEYTKTYLFFEELSKENLLKSIKSGQAFVSTGDLITDLDFYLESSSSKKTMGSWLLTNERTVNLRIKVQLGSNQKLHHIDLITGEVKPQFSPSSKDYDSDENPSAKVYLRINLTEMQQISEKVYEFRTKLELPYLSGYFRLRGTNLAPSTPYETDENGNPLIDDSKERPNTKEIALKDTWFYCNPIFYRQY